MMYAAICKEYRYKSHLGEMTFLGVPVSVKSKGLSGKSVSFGQVYATAGDIIDWMERETAKKFVIDFKKSERKEISKDEIYGIMVYLGVNQSELAKLLSIDKGTVTKLLKGSFKMKATESVLLITYLFIEILKPGIVKKSGQEALFYRSNSKKDLLKPETNYEDAA